MVVIKRTNGRNRTIRTFDNLGRERLDTLQSSHRSIRLSAVYFRINESTERPILKWDLGVYPYKIQIFQKLLIGDYQKRLNFAQLMIELKTTITI